MLRRIAVEGAVFNPGRASSIGDHPAVILRIVLHKAASLDSNRPADDIQRAGMPFRSIVEEAAVLHGQPAAKVSEHRDSATENRRIISQRRVINDDFRTAAKPDRAAVLGFAIAHRQVLNGEIRATGVKYPELAIAADRMTAAFDCDRAGDRRQRFIERDVFRNRDNVVAGPRRAIADRGIGIRRPDVISQSADGSRRRRRGHDKQHSDGGKYDNRDALDQTISAHCFHSQTFIFLTLAYLTADT